MAAAAWAGTMTGTMAGTMIGNAVDDSVKVFTNAWPRTRPGSGMAVVHAWPAGPMGPSPDTGVLLIRCPLLGGTEIAEFEVADDG